MRYITPRHMIGFNDELRKEAAIAGLARSALRGLKATRGFFHSPVGKTVALANRELSGRYGRQVAVGAGAGAIGGAAIADPEQGMGGRISGAVKGGLVGAGAGLGKTLVTREGRKAVGGGLSRFYQRQRYSLTGKGLGKTDVEKLEKARKIGLVEKFDPSRFKYDPELLGSAASKANIKVDKARLAEKARIGVQEHALKQGYMSAPGTVHGLLTRPGDVLKSGWKRGGGVGKLFAGLGAYETGKGLIEKPEPGGPGRLEKGLRGAGSAVGWMVAPSTLLGGQMLGMGGAALGGRVGKLGDRVVRGSAQPQYAQPQGRVVPQGGY